MIFACTIPSRNASMHHLGNPHFVGIRECTDGEGVHSGIFGMDQDLGLAYLVLVRAGC